MTEMKQLLDHRVPLDELSSGLAWMKRVSGVDDEYIAQWDISEWAQWYRAMTSSKRTPNPCVPSWMHDIIGDDWSKDWSLPFPSIGQLWPTAHNWFVEHDSRDDFQLTVIEPAPRPYATRWAPTLQQLDQAWHLAKTHPESVPLMMVDLLPATSDSPVITGEVSAFIVAAKTFQSDLVEALTEVLQQPSDTPHLLFEDPSQSRTKQNLVVLYELHWMG